MSGRRCVILRRLSDIPPDVSPSDCVEIERFADYLRRVSVAQKAGVPGVEAAAAIYPDAYPDDHGVCPMPMGDGGAS